MHTHTHIQERPRFWSSLIILFLLSTNSIFGTPTQTDSIGEKPSFIIGYPDQMNGYLVFDPSQASDVETWVCSVKRLVYNTADSSVFDTIVATYSSTNDYLLLPKLITESNVGLYLLDVAGYDSDNDIVVFAHNILPFKEDPFKIGTLMYGVEAELACKSTCNGTTYSGYLFPYAWDICLWEMKSFGTSLGTYMHMRAGTYTTSNGESANYWAYYDASNWSTWCNQPSICTYPKPGEIEPLSSSSGTYYDPGGNLITGPVVAVRKNAGPWAQGGGLRAPTLNPALPFQNSLFAFTSGSFCGSPQSSYITQMNNYGDFNPSTGVTIPSVVCHPTQGGGGSAYGGTHSWTLDWLNYRQNRLMTLDDSIWIIIHHDTNNPWDTMGGQIPPISNIWTLLSEIEREAEINIDGQEDPDDIVGPFGVGESLTEFITGFYVTDFFDPETRVEFIPDEWFDQNGNFVDGPNGSLPDGFYIFTVAYTNGEILYKVVEVDDDIDYSYDKSNLITPSVNPAPLERNEYINFEFISAITDDVEYELVDLYGTEYLTHTFSINAGNSTDQLTVPSGIGTGIVFHRFIFSDESVVVIQSSVE
ncbi:MAG: hypothetical protein R2813_08085 [Flavobacteriales bacterium]